MVKKTKVEDWEIFMLSLVVCFFFQNQLFWKNSFRIPSGAKKFGPDQARKNAGPDLGPNCLQRLSADDTI